MKSSIDGLGKSLMSDGFVPVERGEVVCEFRYGLAEYVARHLIQPFIASGAERKSLGSCQHCNLPDEDSPEERYRWDYTVGVERSAGMIIEGLRFFCLAFGV